MVNFSQDHSWLIAGVIGGLLVWGFNHLGV